MSFDYPEHAVRREILTKYFVPMIGKSTFFDLVERGKIVPLKGLRGYYRLNESLRRLGMPPVQNLPLAGRGLVKLDELAIVDLALSLVMPGELLMPSALLDMELSAEQVLKIGRLARAYGRELSDIKDRDERMGFAQGVRDAAYLAQSVA